MAAEAGDDVEVGSVELVRDGGLVDDGAALVVEDVGQDVLDGQADEVDVLGREHRGDEVADEDLEVVAQPVVEAQEHRRDDPVPELDVRALRADHDELVDPAHVCAVVGRVADERAGGHIDLLLAGGVEEGGEGCESCGRDVGCAGLARGSAGGCAGCANRAGWICTICAACASRWICVVVSPVDRAVYVVQVAVVAVGAGLATLADQHLEHGVALGQDPQQDVDGVLDEVDAEHGEGRVDVVCHAGGGVDGDAQPVVLEGLGPVSAVQGCEAEEDAGEADELLEERVVGGEDLALDLLEAAAELAVDGEALLAGGDVGHGEAQLEDLDDLGREDADVVGALVDQLAEDAERHLDVAQAVARGVDRGLLREEVGDLLQLGAPGRGVIDEVGELGLVGQEVCVGGQALGRVALEDELLVLRAEEHGGIVMYSDDLVKI